MLPVPDHFARHAVELCGDDGRAWLECLPALLDACAQQWNLALAAPFPNLSYHYAAPALQGATPVVLKACLPMGEFRQEAEAMRLFDGRGAARLLAVDRDRQVMLLERLIPGTLLSTVADDAQATSAAAAVMRRLWQPVPAEHPFPTVADWGEGFARTRRRFDGGTGPLPATLFAAAEAIYAEFDATAAPAVLLHGDLHHENILAADREPWLAIDPKGLIGEPTYETGALLRNRLPQPLAGAEARRGLARRADQLSEELNLGRERVRGWAFTQAVLSALWSLEDEGYGWEPAIACAELFAAMKP